MQKYGNISKIYCKWKEANHKLFLLYAPIYV